VDGIAVARTLNEGGKLQALASWKASRPLVDGQISAEFPAIGRPSAVAISTRSTCHSYAVELCIYYPSTDWLVVNWRRESPSIARGNCVALST
jgi:hypothetical protein